MFGSKNLHCEIYREISLTPSLVLVPVESDHDAGGGGGGGAGGRRPGQEDDGGRHLRRGWRGPARDRLQTRRRGRQQKQVDIINMPGQSGHGFL